MLIASGLDVVFVSRQLGHSKADITLRVYAHLFSRREARGAGAGCAVDELRGGRGGQ